MPSSKEFKEKSSKRGKHYYAIDHNFDRVNNEVPQQFSNQIVCGDSLNVLKELPNNCIDLIFTSPPYNFGVEYDNDSDIVTWDHYFSQLFEIFEECIRVIKYGGRILINIQPLFSDYVPTHHIIGEFFREKKMIWRGEIIWDKNYNPNFTAWGSWKSPANPYLKYTWEYIEIFCKGTLQKEGDSSKIDIDVQSFMKWTHAKWVVSPERAMKRFDHPAMFPEELVARALKLFSFQDDMILDPFVGSGTTCVVAKQTDRRFLGIDISEKYCTTAKDRLRQNYLL